MAEKWLSLSGVAEILGVHPSTVRLWSDQGILPVHRTQGGHRRYMRSELELWMQSRRAGGNNDAAMVVQNALRSTRFHVSEGRLREESWYMKLDDEAREQYRRSGRALLQGLTDFMASDGEKGRAEAHALGYEYASRGRRYNLSNMEAVHAFLFFRTVLVEAMLSVYEAASIQSAHAWSDMMRKMNDFTDRIMLAILETYEAYNRSSNR